jgi:YVTN family beta-propeller protein
MTRNRILTAIGALALVLGATPSQAQKAYITNSGSGTVSVIDTTNNTVVGGPIAVGTTPAGSAVTPDGSKVYVTNFGSKNVSVIARPPTQYWAARSLSAPTLRAWR